VRSRSAAAFICRTATGSDARSSCVLALDTVSSVLEYTILSAARQISEVLDEGRLVGRVQGLPCNQHFVHPAPQEIGADRPRQVVDERVHFPVRLGPVEVAVPVRDVPVERHDRRVDQLRHEGPACRWFSRPFAIT
jgi:hypothetical protein